MPSSTAGLAIIGGTGLGSLPFNIDQETISTEYGPIQLGKGSGEHESLWFLSRHGPGREWPPHMINYRANISALVNVGVEFVVASFAVGSVSRELPPGSAIAIDQLIDLTSGRTPSFFEGGTPRESPWWLDFADPFCPGLRHQLIHQANEAAIKMAPKGTYVCFNGPRLETAAEIRMAAVLGGDVVGMTAAPEAALAAEAGLHYAGIAVSVNWASGVQGELVIDREAQDLLRPRLLPIMLDSLYAFRDSESDCMCERRRHYS